MAMRADHLVKRITAGTPRARAVHRCRAHCIGALFAALVPLAGALAQEAPAAAAPPARVADAGSPVSPAVAAEKGGELQEIIVTATRHAEEQSKVPVSLTAFTQESMELKGIKDITEVVRYTPGITIDAEGTNVISIRGISSSAGAATTGVYIDDTPVQMRSLGFNTDNAVPNVFDLERVEVLRGPQGTLFGAGAEGGAVRYIMVQPNMSKTDLMARSELSFTQGGAPSYEMGVAGGTPIVENVLGVRASVWFRHDGGWIDRLDPFTYATVEKHANYQNTFATRLAAKWAVNDAITVTPSVQYQDRTANDVSTYFPYLSDPGSDSYKNAWATPRHEPDRFLLPALKVETELGKAALISNTSYFTRRDTSGYDATMYNLSLYQTYNNPSNTNFYPYLTHPLAPGLYPLVDGTGLHLPKSVQNYRAQTPITNQQQTFAQEIRLQSDDPAARLTWTTGLFFSRSIQASIEEINDPGIAQLFQTLYGTDYTAIFGEGLLANGDAYYNRNSENDRQLAVFGEASYAVTDKLKATVGLRFSRIDARHENFANGPQNFGVTASTGEEHEKPVTPKFSLGYQATRDDLFYATYAKGFRPGGANPLIPQAADCSFDLANLGLTAAPGSYKSDSTRSFEIGSKNKIGDSLRVSSSLYYIKWDGIQQEIYMSSCGFQFTGNVGAAVSKGGDVQIEWAPTAALDFDLAIGHTDARLSANVGTGPLPIVAKGDAVEGQSFGAAPPWTVAFGAQYGFQALDHKSFVRLDFQYFGHSGVASATEDPSTGRYDQYIYTPKASSYVSLRAGTTIDKWSVAAFVDNLFDSHPQALDSSDYHSARDPFYAGAQTVLNTAYTSRPRTLGVSLAYHL